MKRGFTLLELVVVIVIIGILATLGLVQYAKVIEKGRLAEARASLGLLRTLQTAYNQEKGAGATSWGDLSDVIGTGLPSATSADYYFYYSCVATTGTCTATRCTATPCKAIGPAYNITLTSGGGWGGTAGYY